MGGFRVCSSYIRRGKSRAAAGGKRQPISLSLITPPSRAPCDTGCSTERLDSHRHQFCMPRSAPLLLEPPPHPVLPPFRPAAVLIRPPFIRRPLASVQNEDVGGKRWQIPPVFAIHRPRCTCPRVCTGRLVDRKAVTRSFAPRPSAELRASAQTDRLPQSIDGTPFLSKVCADAELRRMAAREHINKSVMRSVNRTRVARDA